MNSYSTSGFMFMVYMFFALFSCTTGLLLILCAYIANIQHTTKAEKYFDFFPFCIVELYNPFL